MRIVGYLKTEWAKLIGLNIVDDTPIYLGQSNIDHMISRHPKDYAKYGEQIELILSEPDYIGQNKKDNSIEIVKEFFIDNEFVKVAIRISRKGNMFARTLYILNSNRVYNFISKGTLKRIK